MTPFEFREKMKQGKLVQPTAGLCQGFVQANVVILPQKYAEEFLVFCEQNAQACPVIASTRPGEVCFSKSVAKDSDIRYDLAKYRIFKQGVLQEKVLNDISQIWQHDFVSFLIGCSFTFESALMDAGLPLRHIDSGCNVSMYKTNIACKPKGVFSGNMVVSMRPFDRDVVEKVIEISSMYPKMHGAPVHIGSPEKIGIMDINAPDFGDKVEIKEHEVPVFWGCGVTPQLALVNARLPIAITHSPGYMFITDIPEGKYRQKPVFNEDDAT